MVFIYWSSKFVVHAGLRRSIEPLRGSARSILREDEYRVDGWEERDVHGINASLAEQGHALVVIISGVDAVHADGIDFELLEEGDVTLAGIGILEGVGERLRLREGVVWVGGQLPCDWVSKGGGNGGNRVAYLAPGKRYP